MARIGLAVEIYDGCPHMANTPVESETYHIHSQLSPAAFSASWQNKAKVFASYLRQCRVKFFPLLFLFFFYSRVTVVYVLPYKVASFPYIFSLVVA